MNSSLSNRSARWQARSATSAWGAPSTSRPADDLVGKLFLGLGPDHPHALALTEPDLAGLSGPCHRAGPCLAHTGRRRRHRPRPLPRAHHTHKEHHHVHPPTQTGRATDRRR